MKKGRRIATLAGVVALQAASGSVLAAESLGAFLGQCEAGKTWYCYFLARGYESGTNWALGIDTPQDAERAAVFWRKTCDGVAAMAGPDRRRWGASLGVVEHCWGSKDEETLRQECEGGEGAACQALLLRHSDKNGVPQDPTPSGEWLLRACDAGFGQACFTNCLARLDTCSDAGWGSGPEPYLSVRAFVPARDNEERRRMLATSRDTHFLLWMGRQDAYAEIRSLPEWASLRHAAHARLTELAQTDPDPGIRVSAVTDMYSAIPEDVLKQAAATDPSPNVRKAAKERLARELNPIGNPDDAAEAARMAKSPDRDTRAAGVRKLVNVALLCEIAQKDGDAGIREDAVDQLADHADEAQDCLKRIAEKDRSERVRAAAAGLVTDTKALERLLRSPVDSVRRHALENLDGKRVDSSLLLWVAENDSDGELREEAVRQIKDQSLLARLATSGASAGVRRVAVAKLEDQKLIGDVAVRDRSEVVYGAAITVIKDEAVLADVMRRRPENRVLEMLAGKVRDQGTLGHIARNAREATARSIAIRRLTDQALLEEIAGTDPDPMVRDAARKRLSELHSAGKN